MVTQNLLKAEEENEVLELNLSNTEEKNEVLKLNVTKLQPFAQMIKVLKRYVILYDN